MNENSFGKLPKYKTRTILHIDGDAFFVGVEVAKNPKLKGKAVVTGEERGIVSALSYEAKALGIKRGMPIFQIKKNFKDVIILPGDYASYTHYSELIFDIVRRYADTVEEYSIDECFADLTGLLLSLNMTAKEIGEKIKSDIIDELRLSVSIGIAPTKTLAKVASKWVKPNGLTVIEKKEIKKFLQKVPIEKVWGIGPQTSTFLKKKGINTANDYAKKRVEWIKRNLSLPYETLWYELNGKSINKVDSNPKAIYLSIQKTKSFYPSTSNEIFLISQLSKHTEDACTKARYYKLTPKKLSFFLKSKNFKYFINTIHLSHPTNSPEILLSLIKNNFQKIYKKNTLYRTTGVILQDLISDSVFQIDLFGSTDKAKKFEKIHEQIDRLEEKIGKRLVHLASTDSALKNKRKETNSSSPNKDLLFL